MSNEPPPSSAPPRRRGLTITPVGDYPKEVPFANATRTSSVPGSDITIVFMRALVLADEEAATVNSSGQLPAKVVSAVTLSNGAAAGLLRQLQQAMLQAAIPPVPIPH